MNEDIHNLYVLILRHGFKVMRITELNGAYMIKLEKWLHWSYEPNRILEEEVTLSPRSE